MRTAWPAPAVFLLTSVLSLAGCHNDEPTRDTTRNASVSFDAAAAGGENSFLYDCWEVWFDQDGNGTCDPSPFHVCQPVPADQGGVDQASHPVPWHYALTITTIAAGTTTEAIVTSVTGISGSSGLPSDTLPHFVSLTNFDPMSSSIPDQNPGNGQCFKNGHRVPVGSQTYIAANNFPVETPNVLTMSPTFDFHVNAGDTIIVRARKQPDAESSGFLPWSPANVTLVGHLSVGGSEVATATSTTDDRAGITMSYNVQ